MNYAEIGKESRSGSSSLPGYKLRQMTDRMAEHVAEEFNLGRLAAQAGLSNAPEELELLPSFSGNSSTAALGAAVKMVRNKTASRTWKRNWS